MQFQQPLHKYITKVSHDRVVRNLSKMSDTGACLRIGVLAIQGAFFEHRAALLKAAKDSTFNTNTDIEVIDIREPDQLSDLDGLILPGGESTTMSLFLQSSNFENVLKEWVVSKEKPKVVWGTCAGLILLSNDIEAQKEGGQSKVEIHLLAFHVLQEEGGVRWVERGWGGGGLVGEGMVAERAREIYEEGGRDSRDGGIWEK